MTIRVDILMASLAAGGAERVTLNLLRGLNPDQFSIRLILLERSGPLAGLVPENAEVVDLKTKRLRHAIPRLLKTLRRDPAEIVFSSIGYLNLALLSLKPFIPGKIVVREANIPSLSLGNTPYPTLFKAGYKTLYRHADCVISTSERMTAELVEGFSVRSDRIQFLPNPVDLETLQAAADEAPGSQLVEQDKGTPHFIAAGRLVRQKGFDRLIPVMKHLPATVKLTIWGIGPDQKTLDEMIEEMGLSGRVNLAGFTDNLGGPLRAADALLLPSRWEGMPNIALEALAMGTPVIATAESGGIAEIAALAPAKAVSVCQSWSDFEKAVQEFALQPNGPLPGTKSDTRLLPPQYLLENAVTRFSEILVTTAR